MSAEHRQALMARMEDAVAVFFAAPETLRNNDVHNPYRQDSDFYYLTGFEEPESVLVLAPCREAGDQVLLFLREKDPERETWDGHRLGLDAAPTALGVDKAYAIDALGQRLPGLLEGATRLYYSLGFDPEHDREVLAALAKARRARRNGKDTPGDVLDPANTLHELRLIKGPAEIAAMRKAAGLAARGHVQAMRVTRPGVRECELQAEMEYLWRREGSERVAYETIVGSGPNACVLHYRAGDRPLGGGEMVLIDAGCEVDYHAADITRTWPVDGRFSQPQRELYELVLKAQLAAIGVCRVGGTTEGVHDTAVRVLTEGMVELGLLQGPAAERIEDEGYKRFYMHRTGHWLGMDVHDVGAYYHRGVSRPFEPGMALTVEPGIYISPDDETAPARYRGIGIRIEDDVLVTEGEPEILSAGVPKTVAEIEALVGKSKP